MITCIDNGNGRKSSVNSNRSKNNIDHDNILLPNKYRYLVTDDVSDFDKEFNNNIRVSVVDKVHMATQRKIEKNKRPQVVTNKYPERNIIRNHTMKTEPRLMICPKPLNDIKLDIVIINIGSNKIGIDDPFEISKDINSIAKT